MVQIIVGAAVAVIGIVSVVFVMRHKSVEKRSMYSARRTQIEHKVRAARQRTLAPHGHVEKPADAPAEPAPGSIFAPRSAAPTVTYEPSAYSPPPAAPPGSIDLPPAPRASPWDVGPTAAPPSPFGPPGAPPPPPYAPAPEPTFEPGPIEPPPPPPSEPPAWTPAPAETLPPVEPARAATPAGAGASWSIVGESKASAAVGEDAGKKKGKDKRKDKDKAQTGAWQLASGEVPGSEDEMEVKTPSAALAIAQYAVLVVGLVMVLIGVLVMVANSHVT